MKDDPDPNCIFIEPEPNDFKMFDIEIIRSLKVAGGTSRDEYLRSLANCNVFIAPRLSEGIGLSFLEAMALGMCVVGTETPTMNEYISHGDNGYFLDLEHPGPIDLDGFAECGIRARASVVRGHEQWKASLPDMLRFIDDPDFRRSPYWTTIVSLGWDVVRRSKLLLEHLLETKWIHRR